MLQKLKLKLNRFVISRALRKRSPSRIPLSGAAVKNRNYYATYLSEDGEHKFLIESLNRNGVEGIWYDNDHEEIQHASIPNSTISHYDVDITQYYNELALRYSSASSFILGHLLQAARLSWFRQWATQTVYNLRTISRTDRVQVLKVLLDKKIENPDQRINLIDLISMLHGERWVLRPDCEQIQNYYEIILSALEAREDVRRVDFGYQLNDCAFNTIAEYEAEERKHRDTVTLQIAIVVLTLALVLVGVTGIVVDLMQVMSRPMS
ncbi:hypothetical protein [Thalassospira sp.]|uniref:hypothetical protein n=1 Tax=Thalassospira sp. TaxID=1912094 RepID=UPI001B158531|nr:hypothetical protein [Thalassospira sp.]MBO6806961.1 hypothetical protein [Thalassospira sp.]MBO6841567.1 hypothetical protein [Thalassospira sp.]